MSRYITVAAWHAKNAYVCAACCHEFD